MSIKYLLAGALVLVNVAAYASPTPDAMRAASAVQMNTKYSSIVVLSKDSDGHIISFHVNGVSPQDAEILLSKDNAPLSTEFTSVIGVTKEGGFTAYMLPSNVATAHVIEQISRDLVNAGSVNIQIAKQVTGR